LPTPTAGRSKTIWPNIASWSANPASKPQCRPNGARQCAPATAINYWNTDLDYTEPGFSSSGDDSGIDPVVGLGFEFTPADNLGIRFEWEQFQNVGDGTKTSLGAGAGNLELNGHDVNIIGIGVTYKFHFAH